MIEIPVLGFGGEHVRGIGPNDANRQLRERTTPVAQWMILLLVALTALWLYIPPPI
jgi:hypothetical protein